MKSNKLLMILLTTCVGFFLHACSNNEDEKSFNNPTVNVGVEQVKNLDGSETFSYSGTIEESESIPLSFSTIGSVARVLVSEGDFVKKGQLLAELNDETFKNAYEMSAATLKQAEDAYKRLQPMYKNGNIPEIKFVEVETGLQQAKAAAAISQKNLNDCKLYSPVNGVVGKRSIEPGMSAMPNVTSINIVKIEKVFARVSVSENEIASVEKGSKAKIKIGALNYAEFTGTVEEVGVLADPISHSYKIKIGIANSNSQIKPGMICSAVLEQQNNSNGVYVSGKAVLVDEHGKNFVYITNQNKASKKYVKTGRLLKNGIEIIEGLNPGDKVVVEGSHKLVDGSIINIVNR